MLPDCAKTRRRKDRWMQVRAGRLEGSWPGFGLDVGTIGRIAFSQNSSRGRRQEEALASCRQTTADQPCQARPSPPDQTRWIRPSPAANLQPAPRSTEPSAGDTANRHRLDPVAHSDGGPCHPGPPPTRLPHRPGRGPLVCPAHVFCSSQQGSRCPRRLGSSPAGAPTSDLRCPLY